MEQVILPFEWHSFCISIDMERKQAALVHNGHIQAVQLFDEITNNTENDLKYMVIGHLGGAKFEGLLTELEVFSKPLPDDQLLEWTVCQNKVSYKHAFNQSLQIYLIKKSSRKEVTCSHSSWTTQKFCSILLQPPLSLKPRP